MSVDFHGDGETYIVPAIVDHKNTARDRLTSRTELFSLHLWWAAMMAAALLGERPSLRS